jgi:hypothetical protein
VFGKFRRIMRPGLSFRIPLIGRVFRRIILNVDGRYKTFLPGMAKEIFLNGSNENMQRTIKELMATVQGSYRNGRTKNKAVFQNLFWRCHLYKFKFVPF